MRYHHKSDELQAAACGAICNLCFSKVASETLMKAGAANWVLNAMKNFPKNEIVQEEGMKALVNLEHGDIVRKKALIRLGAHHVIIDAIRNFKEFFRVQEEGCAAISSLSEAFANTQEEEMLETDNFYTLGIIY